MNGLAYEFYVDKPSSVFQNWHSAKFHDDLGRAVMEAVEANRSLDPVTIARLRWYPALTAHFILTGKINRPDIEKILNTPTVRFNVLANHYTPLAPLLEAELLNDPESCERLVRWLRFYNRTPFHEEHEYLSRLGDDPNRANRLQPASERLTREEIGARAAKECLRNAAWAFLYVSCHAIERLDPQMVKVLLQSEEYSFLAAFVLRRRQIPVAVWEPLLAGLTSPRWAYQAMSLLDPGVSINPVERNRLLRIVHASPPWAVQLWEARGWRGEHLEWAYSDCYARSQTHECLPEMGDWMRMIRSTSLRRVAAA